MGTVFFFRSFVVVVVVVVDHLRGCFCVSYGVCVTLPVVFTASLAWWLRYPPRERQIRGSMSACAVGIFPGRVKVTGLLPAVLKLLRRDFRAMYYEYCQGKSFQNCFQSLKTCF